jgi:Fe-S cluster assembly iron-binding protein IscA
MTGTFKRFDVPANTRSLRIEATPEKDQEVFGKIRITCQNLQLSMDLKSIESSKNTILDYTEDEIGIENMIYNVPAIDT